MMSEELYDFMPINVISVPRLDKDRKLSVILL